jgi:hypothetical protein
VRKPALPRATAVERIAGSTASEAALTYVGALAATPLAALLPVLAKSLACVRQKKRVEAAIAQIDSDLARHEELIRTLSDEKYKLINEAVLAVLQTTSERKLSYLRRAINNSLLVDDLQSQEAVVLSRIVRDISAEEADFLLANFQHNRIQISSSAAGEVESHFRVRPDSRDGLLAMGLFSLGVLVAAEPTWDDSGLLRFSPIAAKLIVLLRVEPGEP